jgi:hypothetical protein
MFFIITLFHACSNPNKPLGQKKQIYMSDIVAYVKVVGLDSAPAGAMPGTKLTSNSNELLRRNIKTSEFNKTVGKIEQYPEQKVDAKILKILKGPTSLEGQTIAIIKPQSYFLFKREERQIVYLKKFWGKFKTISPFSGETRIASALAAVNEIYGNNSGVVIGISNPNIYNQEMQKQTESEFYVLIGRHKAPLSDKSKNYQKSLYIKVTLTDLCIKEIKLQDGSYTILKKLKNNGEFESFNRLVDGFYPFIVLKDNKWQAVYF